MEITQRQDGDSLVIALAGELDHHAALDAMGRIATMIDAGVPRQLVLDLSALSFMDSSGIAVVMQAMRACRDLDGEMKVRGAPAQPLRVLKAAGITRLLTFE